MAAQLDFQRGDSSESYDDSLTLAAQNDAGVFYDQPNSWTADNSSINQQNPLVDLLFPEGLEALQQKHALADAEDSPDYKRQELGLDNDKRKPGRKPIVNEPTSKRKAQNRAAQRAFRERKENHVKELEARVAELERQNNSKSAENAFLKEQLAKARKSSQDLSLVDFDPTFTFAIPPPSTSHSMSGSMNSPHTAASSTSVSARHESECPSLSSGNSPLSASEKDFNPASMPIFSRQYSVPDSQASRSPLYFTGAKTSGTNKATTEATENALFFENMLSPSKDLNFDAFNPMEYRENSNPINYDIDAPLFEGVDPLNFEPEFPDYGFMSPAATQFSEPANMDPSISKQKSLDNGKDVAEIKLESRHIGTDTNGNPIGCKDVWKKIVAHPKFDSFDIDELCHKMKSQARCSQAPPLYDQKNEWERFNKMLDEYAEAQSAKQTAQAQSS